MFIGPTEVPSQFAETIKILNSHYEFGANFVDPNVMLIGRVLIDGRLNARVKWDLTDNPIVKANAQLTNEPHMSHGMVNFDSKGKNYRSYIVGLFPQNSSTTLYTPPMLLIVSPAHARRSSSKYVQSSSLVQSQKMDLLLNWFSTN